MTGLKCHQCVNKRDIPGDCHVSCAKPDPNMEGHIHGVRNGWFFYPYNFDPGWGLVECANFEEKTK